VISQTTDGYLWIGTRAGLVRFDGVRFVSWTPPDGQHLPSSNVTSLLGARDGSLWIGMEGGLSRWDKQHLTNYLIKPELINSMVEDRNGAVWFVRSRLSEAAEGGLCQIIGTGMRCYGQADGMSVSDSAMALVEDSLDNLWIGGDTAVVRWKPGSSSTYTWGSKSTEGMDGARGLAANPDGSVWVGIAGAGRGLGLQQLVQGAWKPFVAPKLDSSTLEVQALFLDREKALWIGTGNQGIYRIHGRTVDHFHSTDGLSGDTVWGFYEDREGNLWVATSKGIDCFRGLRVGTFSTREGLTPEVDSVLAAQDGTVWIGGALALDAIHQAGVSSIQAGKDLPGNQVTSLLEDHARRLWVGVDQTMSIYKDGKFRRIDRPDGRPIGLVVGMTEDVDNNIWVESKGPPMTLIRVHDLKVQEEFPVPQVPAARKVAADPQGGIWLGLMNGDLARYRHGKTEIFPFQHGGDSRVNQLIVNSDGSVLGATGLGVVGWKEGKQQTLTVRNGLPCDFVNALIEDSRGALWLYTQCGLVEIAGTEMQRWWGRPDLALQLKTFDAFDGVLPGRAPFGGAARSPDGRLWFANGAVLQMIDPGHLSGNALPPPVHVEEVIADRKSYSPSKDLRLPPLTRDLEIDYTALSFVVPQKVRFRYKLEGHDLDWQDPGTRREAFYSDLRPGNYKFRVIASNNDGIWNEAGATLGFSVVPAWYQTIWFRVSWVAVFGVSLWVLYHLRLRRIELRNRELTAQVAERTGELRVAKENAEVAKENAQAANQAKTIFLANMSHELRTPLNAILGFSRLLGRQPLPPAIQEDLRIIHENGAHLLQLINQVLDLSKIEAGRTTLNETLTDLHQLLEDVEATFALQAEDKGVQLLVERAREVPRLVALDQLKLREVLLNLLGNALKFTDEGTVTLRASQNASSSDGASESTCSLAFVVSDTGPGISVEELATVFESFGQSRTGRERREGTGLGLTISANYVKLMGGEVHLESEVGRGTTVRFEIPARLATHAPSPVVRRRPVAMTSGHATYRILVADDGWAMRKLVRRIVEPLGFELREARDGDETVKVWKEWRPNLICMDLRMPGVDGYEATRRIKAEPEGKSTSIIAVTASGFEDQHAAALEAGCDGYLRKPFSEEDLFEMLQKHLGLRFRYAEESAAIPPVNGGAEAVAQALASLPAPVRARLRRALEQLDVAAVQGVLDEIRGLNGDASDTLRALTANYQYGQLLHIIDDVESGGSS